MKQPHFPVPATLAHFRNAAQMAEISVNPHKAQFSDEQKITLRALQSALAFAGAPCLFIFDHDDQDNCCVIIAPLGDDADFVRLQELPLVNGFAYDVTAFPKSSPSLGIHIAMQSQRGFPEETKDALMREVLALITAKPERATNVGGPAISH